MLSEEQVRHTAKLARIKLTDEEVGKFCKQISSVLEYVEMLSEVDTDGVSETSQVTGLRNVMEKDEILPAQADRVKLLAASELPVDDHCVRVMRVVK